MYNQYANYIKLYIDNNLLSPHNHILIKETIDNKYYISFRTDEGLSYIYDANGLTHPLKINPTTICEKIYEHISFYQNKYDAKDELKRIILIKDKILNKLYKENIKLFNNILFFKNKEEEIISSICKLYSDEKVDITISDTLYNIEHEYYPY